MKFIFRRWMGLDELGRTASAIMPSVDGSCRFAWLKIDKSLNQPPQKPDLLFKL